MYNTQSLAMNSYQAYDEKHNNFIHDAIYFTNYDPENDTLLKLIE